MKGKLPIQMIPNTRYFNKQMDVRLVQSVQQYWETFGFVVNIRRAT